MGIIFYKDIKDTFECDIKVEGTSLSESKVRLLLKFKNRSYIFDGNISEHGHVKVDVPTLNEVADDSGHATLEVIADSTYFEAWSSRFDLKKKKSLSVNEVAVSSSKDKVMVENVSAERGEPKKEQAIYREGCSDKNKKFIQETFNRFKSLPKTERKKIKRELGSFQPTKIVNKWGKSVFNESDTLYAKLCMKTLQEGMKRG